MKIAGLSETVVNEKDSADFYRVILPPDTNEDRVSFVVNDYYMNGIKKMIGKTSRHNQYLKLQGVNVEFFPNGKKKSIKNFIDNNPSGDVTEYFPNGKIYLIGLYDSYNRLVITECRDSTGKITAENGNGRYVLYDANFKNISLEGNIINNWEEGEWHGRLNDSVKYTLFYEKGIINNGIGYDKKGKEYRFTKIEVDPSFSGGIEKFFSFISRSLHYSKEAKDHNIQGKVIATFVVERDGKLSDIKVLRGLGYGLDEEVVRMLKLSPPWVPGYQYGIPVRVQYTVPVSFTMTIDNY